LKAQLANSADHKAAIILLKQRVAAIPNVLATPAPDVEMLEFTRRDRYWRCVHTATTTTIGRYISIPTGGSGRRWEKPDSRCRNSRWPCAALPERYGTRTPATAFAT
jgi:hypothetical protein